MRAGKLHASGQRIERAKPTGGRPSTEGQGPSGHPPSPTARAAPSSKDRAGANHAPSSTPRRGPSPTPLGSDTRSSPDQAPKDHVPEVLDSSKHFDTGAGEVDLPGPRGGPRPTGLILRWPAREITTSPQPAISWFYWRCFFFPVPMYPTLILMCFSPKKQDPRDKRPGKRLFDLPGTSDKLRCRPQDRQERNSPSEL